MFPLVTVIIPTIGRPAYLGDAIRSAVAQDYPRLEILVSENKPDRSCRAFLPADLLQQVKLMERPHRLDIVDHFNTCLHDALGEYVLYLSDDDMLEPGYVTSAIKPFLENDGVIASLGRQLAIGEHFAFSNIRSEGQKQTEILTAQDFFYSWLIHTRRFGMFTYLPALARKSDYIKIGGFRNYPDGSGSDLMSIIGLVCNGRLAVTPMRYFYRVYPASVGLSTQFDKLITACAMLLSDAGRTLARSTIPAWEMLIIKCLLRLRMSSMMARRLVQLYRKRLTIKEFFISAFKVGCFALYIYP